MNPSKTMTLLIAGALFLFAGVASPVKGSEAKQTANQVIEETESNVLVDQPIAEYQAKLLDLAMDTATAIPTHPHIKDRSLSQSLVAGAAIDLGQPKRALGYLQQILNWRQGSGYAHLGLYVFNQGHPDLAEVYLERAETLSDHAETWRKDRIRRQVAVTRAWMGEDAKADWLQRDLMHQEQGMVDAVRATKSSQEDYERYLTKANTLMGSNDFDLMRNATRVYLGLYEAFYHDVELRERAIAEMKKRWGNMVMTVKLDVYARMAEIALDKGDQENALAIVDETSELVYSFQWPLRYGVPVKSRVEVIRFLAGDTEAALTRLDEIRAELEGAPGGGMFDIYLAETYTSLAEAYNRVKKPADALALYRKAVESGDINPNSRPKAEDLSATAISMATHEVEPDEQLWDRMLEIRQRLGNPW